MDPEIPPVAGASRCGVTVSACFQCDTLTAWKVGEGVSGHVHVCSQACYEAGKEFLDMLLEAATRGRLEQG